MVTKAMPKDVKYRAIALLNREEVEFLEKLGMDALFSTGHKLTKVEIIAALIDAAIELKVSGKGAMNKETLMEKILENRGKV